MAVAPQNKRQVIAVVVSCTLLVLWCAFIFYMSAQPADDSTAISNEFSFQFLSIVWPDFSTMSPADQQYWCDTIDHPVRKLAHFSEYALLGVLMANVCLRAARLARRDAAERGMLKAGALSWAIATCYAATDEFHQMFVPGRACLITDVLIDSSGVALGVVLFCVCWRVAQRRR